MKAQRPDIRRGLLALAVPLFSLLFWIGLGGSSGLWPQTALAKSLPVLVVNEDEGLQLLESQSLLAVYVLAYDNYSSLTTTTNLTTKYTETVQSLVTATEDKNGVTAVILADLDSWDDTHILVVQNGVVTTVVGLPDDTGQIDPALAEYNTADGHSLGGFLLWTRQNFPATKTIFSYIGHGAPLAPKSSPAIADIVTHPSLPERMANAVPMPTAIDAHPDFTDHHVPDSPNARVLTPYDLALALNIGANGGADKIDVLDLIHCFAASIEELYEAAPYAETTVAAPNYAFFDPAMPGIALTSLELDMTPVGMANDIVGSYFSVIPSNHHPHILIAVDNTKLINVKQNWDGVAAGLLTRFAEDPDQTGAALLNAYIAASPNGLYDTTYCGAESDNELAPPDALTDMWRLALEIENEFSSYPEISLNAQATADAIYGVNGAIIENVRQFGEPWWDPTPASWAFTGAGIALFTPFETMTVDDKDYHAWQALWYTTTHTISEDVMLGGEIVSVTNPHPYQFIVPLLQSETEFTWADVIHAYWEWQGNGPFQDVSTAFCVPKIKEIEAPDMSLGMDSETKELFAGSDLAYELTIVNKTTLSLTNVVVTDSLPDEASLVSILSDYDYDCDKEDHLVICNLGDVAGHETATVTINILIDPTMEGRMINTAVIHADTPDQHPQDNIAIISTNILPLHFYYIPLLISTP